MMRLKFYIVAFLLICIPLSAVGEVLDTEDFGGSTVISGEPFLEVVDFGGSAVVAEPSSDTILSIKSFGGSAVVVPSNSCPESSNPSIPNGTMNVVIIPY